LLSKHVSKKPFHNLGGGAGILDIQKNVQDEKYACCAGRPILSAVCSRIPTWRQCVVGKPALAPFSVGYSHVSKSAKAWYISYGYFSGKNENKNVVSVRNASADRQ
jgi:hypothetical protein